MTSNAIVEALSEKRRSTISRRDLKGKPPKHYIVRYTTFQYCCIGEKIKRKKEHKVRPVERVHSIIKFSQNDQNLNTLPPCSHLLDLGSKLYIKLFWPIIL